MGYDSSWPAKALDTPAVTPTSPSPTSDVPSQDADEPPSSEPPNPAVLGDPDAHPVAHPGDTALTGIAVEAEVGAGPQATPNLPGTTPLLLALAGSIVLAAIFSTLSTSLLRALPGQLDTGLEEEPDAEPAAPPPGGYSGSGPLPNKHPGQVETLAASAGLLAFAARAIAAALVFVLALRFTPAGTPPTLQLIQALAVTGLAGGVVLHLVTMSIPLALAQSHAESIVRAGVPMFAPVLQPTTLVVRSLTGIRRVFLRAVGTPDANYGTRRLVEGFRAMVEGAEMHGDLGADTRELIANVIEFGAADAAEVMTPRTEIEAIEASASMLEAIAVFAECGFSRIPVYVETVDTIIGTLTALEAAKAVADNRVDSTSIRSVMRPPLLVPETQLVPELLGEFRAQRQKMAIVVDEYGGTAGLVTLADVMAEIVGHVQDEFEEEEPPPFQRLADGRVQVDASEHVADINEEAFLSIPEEEDYETLAGFVLAEFGRFPVAGESFVKDDISYEVSEANDRRVLKVVVGATTGRIRLNAELNASSTDTKATAPPVAPGAQGRPSAAPRVDAPGRRKNAEPASTPGSPAQPTSPSSTGPSPTAIDPGAANPESGPHSGPDQARPPIAS